MTSRPDLAARFVDAMRSEHRLLVELVGLVHAQRAAVAANDLAALTDASFGMQRVLTTLNEARRHRQAVQALAGESDDRPVHELEAAFERALDPRDPASVQAARRDAWRVARDELRDAALALTREVDVNRRVLHRAQVERDAYARTLVGAASGGGAGVGSSYGGSGATAAGGGILVDRRG
jgi:hypothetical protein